MCLIVIKGTEKQVITKDMIVFKVLRKDNFPYYQGGEPYVKDVLNKTEITSVEQGCWPDEETRTFYRKKYHISSYGLPKREWNIDIYEEGFHFYTDEKTLREVYSHMYYISKKFLIPAGSEIILDECSGGITNQIMLID